MSYVKGGAASAADVNSIINDINLIVGSPSGSGAAAYGWNQTSLTLSTLSSGQPVLASTWSAIQSRLQTIMNHTGTTISGFPSGSAFTSGNAHAYILVLDGITTTLKSNRFNLGSGTLESNVQSTKTRTTAWGGGAAGIIHDIVFVFSTAAHMQAFFNAGGKFSFTASRTGGSATTQNTSWTTLLSTMGTYSFTRNEFYNATSTLANTAQWVSTSAYSANTITAACSVPASNQFRVQMSYYDGHTNSFSDSVDGTFTSTITTVRPSTLYLNNPAIAFPTLGTDSSTI
ncbi:hypothetical protein RsoM2USA_417 [Ralstonia phage RsoM2USA]|nr:hypothetical protein RsoM2USA_417 [Ralstonia phage RsoM2USA]